MKGFLDLQAAFGVAVVVLTIVLHIVTRRDKPRWLHHVASVGLVLVFIAAAITYFSRHPLRTADFDSYDVSHYYLNTKYYPELGYTMLYHCMMTADSEGAQRFERIRATRSLTTYRTTSRKWVVKHPHQCRDGFTNARWTEFKDDLNTLISARKRSWQPVLTDRGYNGPPVLTAWGYLVTNIVPASALPWVTRLAVIWLVIALIAIAWAYDWRAAALAGALIFTSHAGAWPMIGHTLFRLDWLAFLALALCFARKNHPGWAGVFLVLAVDFRLFPVAFFFPMLTLSAIAGWRRWRRRRKGQTQTGRKPILRRFWIAATTTAVVTSILATSVLGWGVWPGAVKKLALHLDEGKSRHRFGGAVALAYRGETSSLASTQRWKKAAAEHVHRSDVPSHLKTKLERISQSRPLALFFGVVLTLALLLDPKRRQRLDELLLVGFVTCFWSMVVHQQYGYLLAVVGAAHMAHIRSRSHAAALVLLILANCVGAWGRATLGIFPANGLTSVLLAAYTFVLVGPVVVRWISRRQEELSGPYVGTPIWKEHDPTSIAATVAPPAAAPPKA